MKIILASASPRRREILENAGVDFEIKVSDADENTDETNPEKLVRILAKRKADAVEREQGSILISADTVVSIDGEILGKPDGESGARKMLMMLSGKKHTVYTGVCVVGDEKEVIFSEKSDVYFKKLSQSMIENYIKSGECFGKAGGYAIQEKAALMIEKIDGDYLNVVGLPMSRLYDVLTGDFSYKGVI